MPPGGPREGRPCPDIITTVFVRFLNSVVEQRLLSTARSQLFRVQGTFIFQGLRYGASKPIPLLPDGKWIVLCTTNSTTNSTKAVTPAESHPFIITLITRICVVTNSLRRFATGRLAAQQLHAAIRSDQGHQEAVYPVLDELFYSDGFGPFHFSER